MSKEFNANKEAQFDVLPVLKEDRIYGFGNYTFVITGFALATWCFMIGGSLALFVGFKTAIIASIAGNMIAVLIMITATMLPSAKYGTDNYTTAISYAGPNGTKALMIILAFIQAAWVIVFSAMAGRAMLQIYNALTGSEIKSRGVLIVLGLFSALLVWLISLKGPKLMGRLNTIFAPLVVLVMIIIMFTIGKNMGFQVLLDADPLSPFASDWLNFLIAFELSLGAGFSWWPNMGGLARLCKTSRAAYWPNIIGLVFAATLGTAVGVAAAMIIGTTDPSTWMIPIGGTVVGIFSLLCVSMANLTACSIVTYNICIGFKQIRFFFSKPWTMVTGCFMIPVVIGMFFSETLYENFYIILGLACTIYSPVVSIQLIDYFFLRKSHIDLRSLYNRTSNSPYYFWKGFNFPAVIVFLTAIPVYYFFLDPVTLAYTPAFQYVTATGGSTLFSMITYTVLCLIVFRKSEKGGYTLFKK